MERHRYDLGELRHRYEAGATLRQLAREAGVSLAAMHRWLHLAGTRMRPRGGANFKGGGGRYRRILAENREAIAGMTPGAVARRFGLDRSYVYKLMTLMILDSSNA